MLSKLIFIRYTLVCGLDDLDLLVNLAVLARDAFAAAVATALPTALVVDLAVLSLARLTPSFAAALGTALLSAADAAAALAVLALILT